MAQLYRDFTEYALGASVGSGVDDITPFQDAIGYTAEIVDYAVSPSGRAMYLNKGGFTDTAWWTFDELDANAPESGQVYLEFAGYLGDDNNRAHQWSGVCYANTVDGTDQALAGGARAGGGSTVVPCLFRWEDQDSTTIANASSGDYYETEGQADRLRSVLFEWETGGSSVTLRMKSWWKDEAEPAGWFVETTDATFFGAAGGVGWGIRANANRDSAMCFIGIGTDGDPAPTEPVSAGPTTPTNLTTTDITADSFRAGWTA